MRVEILKVGPEQAKAWLSKNTKNRSLRKDVVAKYSSDMSSGNWALNGASIVLDEDGILLDGQHRLSAVVASDTAVDMLVCFGAPRSQAHTIDSGSSRMLRDQLRIAGVHNSTRLGTFLPRLILLRRNGNLKSFVNSVTHAESIQLLEDEDRIHDYLHACSSAERGLKGYGVVPANIFALSYHLAYCIFSQLPKDLEDEALTKLEAFERRLCLGVDLQEGCPEYVLRNRWRKLADARVNILPQDQVVGYMWALRHSFNGTKVANYSALKKIPDLRKREEVEDFLGLK